MNGFRVALRAQFPPGFGDVTHKPPMPAGPAPRGMKKPAEWRRRLALAVGEAGRRYFGAQSPPISPRARAGRRGSRGSGLCAGVHVEAVGSRGRARRTGRGRRGRDGVGWRAISDQGSGAVGRRQGPCRAARRRPGGRPARWRSKWDNVRRRIPVIRARGRVDARLVPQADRDRPARCAELWTTSATRMGRGHCGVCSGTLGTRWRGFRGARDRVGITRW